MPCVKIFPPNIFNVDRLTYSVYFKKQNNTKMKAILNRSVEKLHSLNCELLKHSS